MSKYIHLNMTHAETLPSPQSLLQEFPLDEEGRAFIEQTRQEIRDILDGKDPRLLLIVGPCSIHDTRAALEYATRLHALRLAVSDTFLVVMRLYYEKPRTTIGWKGLLHDPLLNGSNDIRLGLRVTRQLLLEVTALRIPAATEFLDSAAAYYFGDLISWGCIGARTAASQTHRQLASSLPMPVAFKNSTDGNVDVAVNGVSNAATAHTFIGMNHAGYVSKIHTKGNSHGHIVLRGGEGKPNYDPQSIAHALSRLQAASLVLRLLIDCSHGNSFRDHERQSLVFQSIIQQIIAGNAMIRGVLIESNLFSGNQPFVSDPSLLQYAISLTDPCLGWEATEQLIMWGYATLKREQTLQPPEFCNRQCDRMYVDSSELLAGLEQKI